MKKLFLSLLFVAASTSISTFATATTQHNAASHATIMVAGAEWDDILDDYESIVDRLIPLTKKTKAGDATAMIEYTKVLAELVELQERIDDSKNELTATQAARYAKITLKYTQAIQ